MTTTVQCITSEVTYHHFCGIQLVIQTNPGTMRVGTTQRHE